MVKLYQISYTKRRVKNNLGKKKKKESNNDVKVTPSLYYSNHNNEDRINEIITSLEEQEREERDKEGRISKTGRCHCGGYLWWHESLGYYKCGDCLCRYDDTLIHPDLAEVPDSEKP